jgi:predicted Zn-dependent protease
MLQEVEGLMQKGQWDDAITRLQAILQMQPVNARLHGYLGVCYYKKNKFEEAATEFRKAVTLEPHFWEAGVKLAQSLDRLMRYKEALEVAEHYLHLKPNDGTLQALVNGLRRQQGATSEESWERSIKHDFHAVSFSQE